MRNQNIIVKNLTLAETIAHRNPEVANELLISKGYPASRNRDELAQRLNMFLLKNQELGLKALAEIHPDKELLFSNFEGEAKPVDHGQHHGHAYGKHHVKNEGHHNCCGHADGGYSNCSGCNGNCGMSQKHHNADGTGSAKTPAMPQSLFNKDMLAIVGIIALTGIVLIAFNKSSK